MLIYYRFKKKKFIVRRCVVGAEKKKNITGRKCKTKKRIQNYTNITIKWKKNEKKNGDEIVYIIIYWIKFNK